MYLTVVQSWVSATPGRNSRLATRIFDRLPNALNAASGRLEVCLLNFPVMSMGETNMRPTAMLFRNLVSMDVEEIDPANPIDGVVLLCGCDKTTPSLVMGAASCDVPALVVSRRPHAQWQVSRPDIGSGTAVWHFDEELKAAHSARKISWKRRLVCRALRATA